jgi:hypothetical protein
VALGTINCLAKKTDALRKRHLALSDCAKLVDNDPLVYTGDLLREWKRLSEDAARLAIEARQVSDTHTKINDVDLIRFFAQCFDRPAFQDAFHQEGSMEAFDKAMKDTLTAINTGCLRARDGAILSRSWGKSFLSNSKWRQRLDAISDLLRAIRSRYEDGKLKGSIHVSKQPDGREFYCIHDSEIADWMDSTRSQILQIFAAVSEEAGIHSQRFLDTDDNVGDAALHPATSKTNISAQGTASKMQAAALFLAHGPLTSRLAH